MLLSNPDYSNVAFIYDTSRAGMHLWVVRKSHGVAELRYCGAGAQRAPRGKVTGGRGLQSHRSGLSLAGGQNYRSFLGIYEFIRTACGLLGGDTSLTPGYEP